MTKRHTTKAEQRAVAYAELAISYGMEAKVTVQHHKAELYPHSGEVMIPGRTTAWVTIDDREFGVLGDHWHAGWMTWDVTEGHRATTRFMGGTRWRYLSKHPKKQFRTETKFARSLHVYSYRTQKENA